MVASAALDFYRDILFKFLPRWGKCINVFGNYVEKYLVGINALRLTLLFLLYVL